MKQKKLYPQFSLHLRQLRKRAYLSSAELARKLGIPRTTYSNYESGISFPNPETLVEIANILNVKIEELFIPYTGIINKRTKDEIELDTAIRKLRLLWHDKEFRMIISIVVDREMNRIYPNAKEDEIEKTKSG